MRRTLLLGVVAAVVAATLPSTALAQAKPLHSPGDPKLVTFPFDPNNSYKILTRPRTVTNIELERDERVKILAIGDTVSWQAVDKDNHVFIKPNYPKQSTSGSLVTNKRTYQLFLEAGDENDRWYQRVTFQYPDVIARERMDADRALLAADEIQGMAAGRNKDDAKALSTQDPSELHFGYEISGKASFKPAQIYDDGKSTFIRFDGELVDLPALFRLRDGKDMELVEYTNRGNLVIVSRVLEGGLLKLGDSEVRFHNKKLLRKKFFGGYERIDPQG